MDLLLNREKMIGIEEKEKVTRLFVDVKIQEIKAIVTADVSAVDVVETKNIYMSYKTSPIKGAFVRLKGTRY